MTSPSHPAAVTGGIDLDAVATAVRSCPGVDDLDGGPLNAALATYLPGRRIDGLRVIDDTVTVQVRSVWAVPVRDVAAKIRAALAPLVSGRGVDVVIADITPAPGWEPEPEPVPALDPAGTAGLATEPGDPAPRAPRRTVLVTEKVVADPPSADPVLSSAADGAAVAGGPDPGPAAPSRATSPAAGGTHEVGSGSAAEGGGDAAQGDSEGEPVVWRTETPNTGSSDAATSGPTTPTPAVIPPRS